MHPWYRVIKTLNPGVVSQRVVEDSVVFANRELNYQSLRCTLNPPSMFWKPVKEG